MTTPAPRSEDITRLLADLGRGGHDAADRLLPLVYQQLHVIAERVFASAGSNPIVQPTILVHDAFMSLAQKTDKEWGSREHFFAVAAKAMRDLLVDHARRRGAQKRGGDWKRITLSGLDDAHSPERAIDVLELEEVLQQLGTVDPRQERIVELRFFGGLSVAEIARVLDVSERTVLYDWRMARAWLRSRLEQRDG